LPALTWTAPPAGTIELLLLVQDPDVPSRKPATLEAAIAWMKGHVTGRARLDGTYEIA